MSADASSPDPGRTPLIDVNVSYESGATPRQHRLAEPIEVVTRNHVYVLDSTMRCVEVRDAGTQTPAASSSFIGARLVGGQLTTTESTEISYPFPRPGSLAVFEAPKGRAFQFHHTSPVVRVVLRLSIIKVTTAAVTPTWEEVARTTRPPIPPLPEPAR